MMRRLFGLLLAALLVLTAALPAAWAEEGAGEEKAYSVREIILERDGMTIYGELFLPEAEGPLPLVILCHGFGGNHEHMKAYAKAFAKNGIAAYAFDFIGGGCVSKSSGTMKEMSVLTEASDLSAVLDQMKLLPEINPEEIFLLGQSKHLLTLLVIQKLAFLVKKFQRIPLLWIVRCSDDDTTISLVGNNRHLGTRSGAKSDIDNICATAEERALDNIIYHLARDARITTYNDTQSFGLVLARNKTSIGNCKFHNINRCEVFTYFTTYCTTNSGDRFNKCHWV
jgi:hypothetical protein